LDGDLLPPRSPSVASLLPTLVGTHAHVLVASRPGLKLPGDVADGHPLKTTHPTDLGPFGGAQQLAERPLTPPIASPDLERESSDRKVKLFISYSHRDDRYREQLVTHLAGLRRQGIIADWHDRKIIPGQEWRDAIDQNLDAADCVLLLVSPDFLASDYCYSIEMRRILERHREGRVLVIPVIVRPADWQHTPLSDLEVLPKDAKPVVEWARRDRAWLSVAEGIRRALASSVRE
jgi:TIR domain